MGTERKAAPVQNHLGARLRRRALSAAVLTALVLALAPARTRTARASTSPAPTSGSTTPRMEAYQPPRRRIAPPVGRRRELERDLETSPGVFDWTLLDYFVRAAQQHHTQVTLVLAMTPSFYGPASSRPPTLMSDYENFVRAVMLRYRSFDGRRGIAAYQVWNEGNVPYFWSSTPHQLAVLTRDVWRIHQQVDPDATIVAPSFAVRLESQRRWLVGVRVAAGRQASGAGTSTTRTPSASTRWRSTADGPVGPEDAMRLLAMARHRLARAGVPRSTPLWATEINYGVTGLATAATPDRRAPTGGQRHPDLRARRRAWSRPDVLVPLRLEHAARVAGRRHPGQHPALGPRLARR